MTTIGKLSTRKPLSSQSKEILFNLNQYFKDVNDKDMSSITTSAQLVTTSTGIPLSTVKKVVLEGKRALEDGIKFRSPKRTKYRERMITINDDDRAVIRRTIHNFQNTANEVPNMQRLYEKLKAEINYPGSIWLLRKDVSLLGFKWKRTEDNRRILLEKHEIRYLRINYLNKIAEYRAQGRPIIYTDETYLDTSYTDENTSGVKKIICKENRLIIVYAGGIHGFIPNALLMFKANYKTGDQYYMNTENYIKWLKMQLIPNLEPKSVVVVNNGTYHNLMHNPAPHSNAHKQEMIDWLEYRNIVHSSMMLKPQLYELILQNKARFVDYKIDSWLREYGHSVLRLPPYHPELNPIKKVWAMIKGHVVQKNMLINVDSMRLIKEKAETITVQQWKNVCDQAIEEEKKFEGRDAIIDALTEQVIMNLDETSEESDNPDDKDAMSSE